MPCPALRGKTADGDTNGKEKGIHAFHCIIHEEHISYKTKALFLLNQKRKWKYQIIKTGGAYTYFAAETTISISV